MRELGQQPDCAAIVCAVTALSRDLGIAITAEGIETEEQLRALVMARCTGLQGLSIQSAGARAAISPPC